MEGATEVGATQFDRVTEISRGHSSKQIRRSYLGTPIRKEEQQISRVVKRNYEGPNIIERKNDLKYYPDSVDPRTQTPRKKSQPIMGEDQPETLNQTSSLMEQVLERNNLIRALKQVIRHKGAAG